MVCMLLEEDCVPNALPASLFKPLPTAMEAISMPKSLDSSSSQVAVPNLPICCDLLSAGLLLSCTSAQPNCLTQLRC